MDLISKLCGLFSSVQTATSIEPATSRNAPALAKLHRASFHRGWGTNEFEQLLTDRSILAHRLIQDSVIIGFIISRLAADEAEILSVAIAPSHRGRGLSQNLVRTHLGYLAALGIRTVFLEVEENNQPARALYDRAGFHVVGHRDSYYKSQDGTQLNAIVMRRDLS